MEDEMGLLSANQRQIGGDHYKNGLLEHWDLIERHGIGYLEGCATKYVARWRKKNGLQDLEKADHHVQKLIELYDEGVRLPRGVVPHETIAEFCRVNGCDAVEAGALNMLLHWSNRQHLLEAQKDIRSLIATCRMIHSQGTTQDASL